MSTTATSIETIIENNCIDCKHFREPIRSSPCLCDPVYDIISHAANEPEKEQSFVQEWERQQEHHNTL